MAVLLRPKMWDITLRGFALSFVSVLVLAVVHGLVNSQMGSEGEAALVVMVVMVVMLGCWVLVVRTKLCFWKG